MARIAIVGDVMLDAYYYCNVAGFSPEDDLAPKLDVQRKTYKPGGAANVACCLSEWGSEVGLFGACGSDLSCETLFQLLREADLGRVYLPSFPGRRTTCKTRLITPRSRQAVRLDEECTNDLTPEEAKVMVQQILAFEPDALVISDYRKGVVTRELVDCLQRSNVSDLLTIVDPKTPDFDFYGPVFAVTPNEREFEAFETTGDPEPRCAAQHVIVTCAGQGARVLTGGMMSEFSVPVRPRKIGDPAGCGDAFVSALVHALCNGVDLQRACLMASAAGALTFDMLGVASPSWDQIEHELSLDEYKEIRDGNS